jgi:hypothetical protein
VAEERAEWEGGVGGGEQESEERRSQGAGVRRLPRVRVESCRRTVS